jgi:hypothetical protein
MHFISARYSPIFHKRQLVQNTLARSVLCPVVHRVTFKIASLTYKILQTNRPSYLRDILTVYQPSRNLRSQSQHLLQPLRTKTVLAERAFSSSAVAIWNSLPADIRTSTSLMSFRRQLKTYLFVSSFGA